MKEYIKTYSYENKKLKIWTDEDTTSPREWSNVGTMICFHKKYSLGDKHDLSFNSFEGWAEVHAYLVDTKNAVVILPLYLYDHSGISMSTSRDGQFSDHWDSGQVGYIYCTEDKMKEEGLTKEQIKDILVEEVKTYSQYLEGDVYGFTVFEIEKCSLGEEHEKHIDSCGGFYGYDITKNGMKDYIPYFDKFIEDKN